MNSKNELLRELKNSVLWTAFLSIFYLIASLKAPNANDFLFALPFFLILYFTVFSIGKESVIQSLQNWIRKSWMNSLVFPVAMLVVYAFYLLINQQNPLDGNPLLGIYIILFPSVAFALWPNKSAKIGWFDFTVFALILLPGALLKIDQKSEIPFSGGGFDSLFHNMIVLSGVYAFAVVRGIPEVGFFPELKWKSLMTALWVWLAFYASVFAIGYSVDFIQFIGYEKTFAILIKSILFTMIGTFLHTALFEEVFFRGILQNMLARRIGQAKSWKTFWGAGFVLLLFSALLVGYTLEGKMKWFPALVTVLIFAAAYIIENSRKFEMGVYTSLALTGVTFGLVHYHAKSIIYIGFACIAGWAYGYTYIKTKNVFYSALVHMLVNTSVLIFGLKMMR
jgi:hypothetical protein